jgi:hypothetical protein
VFAVCRELVVADTPQANDRLLQLIVAAEFAHELQQVS